MNDPKRYDFKIEYEGMSYFSGEMAVIKSVESEIGQYVTYGAFQNLLEQFDKLEESGLGYWMQDEFILVKELSK